MKTALKSLKQPALTVHGLIFGRAYYRKDFCVCDLGGGVFFFGGGLIIGILLYFSYIYCSTS